MKRLFLLSLRVSLVGFLLGLSLSACTTAPKDSSVDNGTNAPPNLPIPPPKSGASRPSVPVIDLSLLQRQLSLDRNIRDLGFEEKSFDPCTLGISAGADCARRYLTVINFRLQCRDSEGTDETLTAAGIRAIRSDDVKWNLGKLEGQTKTDFEGYGQAVALSTKSQKRERFRLTVKGRYLIITAEHVSRVVAPGPWCRD